MRQAHLKKQIWISPFEEEEEEEEEAAMPKVRTSKIQYPEGWELIEPTLRDLENKMREGKFVCTHIYACFSFPFLVAFSADIHPNILGGRFLWRT